MERPVFAEQAHLARLIVAGLLMAFGQYGSTEAISRVEEIWRATKEVR